MTNPERALEEQTFTGDTGEAANESAAKENPEAKATIEARRGQFFKTFEGYGGLKVAQAARAVEMSVEDAEAIGRYATGKWHEIKDAGTFDKMRYAAAFGACVTSLVLAYAKMPHGAAAAWVAEKGMLAPDIIKDGLAAARTKAPSLVPFLEATHTWVSDSKDILEQATQEALDMFRNDIISLNING